MYRGADQSGLSGTKTDLFFRKFAGIAAGIPAHKNTDNIRLSREDNGCAVLKPTIGRKNAD
ncbi:MAG: hypothetical protein METHP_00688 [Methanoregula sp. SKADARSKE-2]|nr:MAG: hypothetical protein METHP_00688 [Methanoregula sp. SKADARSKE-2]